ncbi:hypothetical protein KSS82_01995 [Vibrio mimicus]|nr:hypothetical protein [Vibrio mimicus]QXC56038.1 hypothetical protein KSS82_01995 [Vibrio mimicus]
MKKTSVMSSVFLSMFLASSAFGAPPAPPGSNIKNLRIVAGNGTSTTSIYANGNMQAKLNVLYDIVNGDSVKNISIKELYTATTLTGWNITDVKNPYFSNDISSRSSSTQLSGGYSTKYLTTNRPGRVSVCVELTTVNGSFESTCGGTTNQSSVTIAAELDQTFTVKDWDQYLHTKMTNSLGDESWLRGYTPPQGRKIAYIDYKGAYSKNGRTPNNAKVIFASPSYNPSVSKEQSTLYVFKPDTGLSPKTFYYAVNYSGDSQKYTTYTVPQSVNTTNSLIFLTNYVFNYGSWISLNPVNSSTFHIRSIDVYDIYGSKTTFYFSRDGLGINII